MKIMEPEQEVYEFGEFKFYVQMRQVHYKGDVRHLEDLHCRLLHHFVLKPWKPCTRDDLLDNVWEKQYVEPITIREAISCVREALRPLGKEILRKLRGKGYYLASEVILVGPDSISPHEEREELLGRLISSVIRKMTTSGFGAKIIEVT